MSKFRTLLGIAIVMMVIIVAIYGVIPTLLVNIITAEKALEQFKRLAQTPEVVIERMSSTAPILGDFFDVSFDLIIEGELKSGRCTSSWVSPIFCRIYDPNSGE